MTQTNSKASNGSAYRQATKDIGLLVAERLEQQRRLIESPIPVNALTGVPYTGLNVFILMGQAARDRRGSNRWIGDAQSRKIGMKPTDSARGGTLIWRPYFRKETVEETITLEDGSTELLQVEKEKFLGCSEVRIYHYDELQKLSDPPADLQEPVAAATVRENPDLKVQLQNQIPGAVQTTHDERVKDGSKPLPELELRLATELATDLALVSAGVDPEPFVPITKSLEIAAHLRKCPERIVSCLALATRAVKAFALANPGLMPVYEVQRSELEARPIAVEDAPAPATKPAAKKREKALGQTPVQAFLGTPATAW